MRAARILGTWNGWTVVQDETATWLVNPITGHRRRVASGCCAWCGVPMPGLEANSHGICLRCAERVLREMRELRQAA